MHNNKFNGDGMIRVALKSDLSYTQYYDDEIHEEIIDKVVGATLLADWEILEWTERSLALVYTGEPSDLTPEVVSIAKKVFSKAW